MKAKLVKLRYGKGSGDNFWKGARKLNGIRIGNSSLKRAKLYVTGLKHIW